MNVNKPVLKITVLFFLICQLISLYSLSITPALAETDAEETTWTFQPTVKVPSFDLTRKCLTLDYAAEDYKGILPGQTEGPIHFDPNAGQVGFLSNGGLSTTPFLGNNITIKILNETNQISSSFSFTADITKSNINADLKGTITDDLVSFRITYQLPTDFRTYTAPIHTALGNEIDGTSYTTLPPEIVGDYTGILTEENNQNIVRGTFTFTLEEQSERLSVYETDYAYKSGPSGSNQKILYCKGQFEYYVTNMKIDGTFVMAQKPDLVAVIVDPFRFQNPDPQFIDNIRTCLTVANFTVQYVADNAVTAEWLKTGLDANLIIWRGHVSSLDDGAWLYTGEETNAERINAYVKEGLMIHSGNQYMREGSQIFFGPIDSLPGKQFFAISPWFISAHYLDGLSDSLIYVEGCRSFDNPIEIIQRAFIGYNNLGAYIGFKGNVYFDSFFTPANEITEKVFQDLAYNRATVKDAINKIPKSYWLATIDWCGNGDLKLSQLGKNKENKHVLTPVYGAATSSSTTTYSNVAIADHTSLTGVNAYISGSLLADGTPFVVSTVNFGNNQPNETSVAPFPNATFFDVKITPDSNLTYVEDVVARISFSEVSFTSDSVISYWNGKNWLPLSTSFEKPNTVYCNIPISDLTGTFFMVRLAGQPTETPPTNGQSNPTGNEMQQIIDALSGGFNSIFGVASNLSTDHIKRITGASIEQLVVALTGAIIVSVTATFVISRRRYNRNR